MMNFSFLRTACCFWLSFLVTAYALAIEAKTTALTELSGKLAERAYAQAGAEGAEGAPDMSEAADIDDSVVDAEFEEVKDDDKK